MLYGGTLLLQKEIMGLVYADIEIINGGDLEMARRHVMGEDEIRRMKTSALVDSGALMFCINQNIQDIMQFPVVDTRRGQLANGHFIACDVVTNVEIRFRNRQTTCRAMVLPADAEVLLGAIPLEDMDVIIHPSRQELIVHPDHPDVAHMSLKTCNKRA